MKSLLIRKAKGWYNLYDSKVGIGSTHESLQGYKLSQENCDEIFGVVDVDKLAELEFDYDFESPLFKELGITKKVNKSILIGMLQGTFIKGFNKAMDYKFPPNNYYQYVVVEIEMDICGDKVYAVPEPKLDEDGCLILKKIQQ